MHHIIHQLCGYGVVVGESVLGEDYICGNFQKWNSNHGFVNLSSVQPFNHWTYDFSGSELSMCDIQGVRRDDKYVITDPCICSKDEFMMQQIMMVKELIHFLQIVSAINFLIVDERNHLYIDFNKLLPKKKASTNVIFKSEKLEKNIKRWKFGEE